MRKSINTLRRTEIFTLQLERGNNGGEHIVFYGAPPENKHLFMVDPDNLFDGYGNRFDMSRVRDRR